MEESIGDPAPTPRGNPLMRKLTLLAVAMFVLWVAGGQLLPKLMGVPRAKPGPAAESTSAPGKVQNPLLILEGAIDRLETLEQRVDALENAPPAAPALPADLSSVTERLDALEAKIAAAAAPPPPPAPDYGSRIEGMDERIAQYQQQLAALSAKMELEIRGAYRTVTLQQQLMQLQEEVTAGKPYLDSLARLRALAEGNPELDEKLAQLEPMSKEGVATTETLKDEFALAVRDALRRAAKANASGSLSGKVSANLSSLITIRRTGAAREGDDSESIIARAEAQLERGRVDLAMEETAALKAPEAQAFTAWMERARLSLLAQSALRDLRVSALAKPQGA